MPRKKNVWTYTKKRKSKKAKQTKKANNKVSVSEAELIESSRLPDPDGPSTSIELRSHIPLNDPVKKELSYPDTRFQHSTTLFPAKTRAEEELISTSSKKRKIDSDSPETEEPTIDDDVTILNTTKEPVKVEEIDLTDESCPIYPILCSPVRTSYLQNRLNRKPNTTLQGNGDVRVKVEKNKASENSSELNSDKSNVDIHKSINIPLDNPSHIEVKSEKNRSNESNNCFNINESPIVPFDNNKNINIPLNIPSLFEVTAEKNKASENSSELNSDKSYVDIHKSINIPLNNPSLFEVTAEKNKASENSSELNSDKSYVDIHKSINIPLDNPSHIEVKSEKNRSNESNNCVNINESPIVPFDNNKSINIPLNNPSLFEVTTEKNRSNESNNFNISESPVVPFDNNKSINIPLNNPSLFEVTPKKIRSNKSNNNFSINESPIVTPFNNHIQIKTEPSELNKNHNEVNFEKSDAVSRHTDNATLNSLLRSEQLKENENSRPNTVQIPVSNTVSACIAKNASDAVSSVNHLFNAVPIKVEQNENCVIGGTSSSVSNLFSDGMGSVDLPVKTNQNKTHENYESSENNLPSSVSSTEIPSDILYGSEHLSNVINNKQTEKKTNDLVAHHSVYNEEAQRNVIYDENQTSFNSTVNCLLTTTQMRNEPEKMDFLENTCNYEKSQNYEYLSQKGTNSNNESIGVVPSETLISDQLNRISISPVTDGGIFDGCDSQLYKTGTFRTPLLKYFNCNTKANVLQMSYARSVLSDLIKDKKEISVIGSDVFSDSQSKFELSVAEKREELSNLHVSEKQSVNLEVEEILHKMASWPNLKEVLNLKPNISNLDSNASSSQLENVIAEEQNSLYDDCLGNEKRLNSSPNRHFESPAQTSECSQLSHSDSRANYFDSPMDVGNPLKDNYPSTICLSSLDDHKQSETSKNQSMKAKTIDNDELFSNDFLRQILGNAKSTEHSDDISNLTTSSSSPLDPVNKSNIIIDESVFQNLRQINLLKNKLVDDINSVSNVNKKNSDSFMKKLEIVPEDLAVPNTNVFKRTQDVLFNPSATCADAVEAIPKKVKISKDTSISKTNGVRKLSLDEYKKKNSRVMDSPRYPPDPYLTKQSTSESPSNSSDSSSGFGTFDQNMFTSPANRQNRSLPVCSDTSLQNTGYRPMVNKSYLQDPRLARNNSRSLYKEKNSQSQLGSFNISQTHPSQIASEATKSFVQPPVKQKPSIPTFNTMRNSSNMSSAAELYRPSVKKRTLSELSSIHPPDFNQRNSEKYRRVLIPSPPSESRPFSISPDTSDQSIPGVIGRQTLSFPHLTNNASSLTHHRYSFESVNRESMLNPPLPAGIPSPPPLPPAPPIVEKSFSIASNRSPNSFHHNYKQVAATKNARNQSSSEFSFVSLLSKQLTEDIGRKLINTNDVYLIIIERNIEWIHGIDREIGFPRISEIGNELRLVRDSYVDHLTYYNTYFPLLLLECFSKISTALKGAKEKEKTNRHVCKVVECETMQSYVSITCDSFIDQSDVDNIPKDGHIVLVKFSTKPAGNVKVLGYVCSSLTRSYSHKHDHGHEILRFVNTNKILLKIKITFYIVFAIPGINLDAPIQITKLTSIKKTLLLNEALKKLELSPLCDIVIHPWNTNKRVVILPRRQDTSAMTTLVQEIVQTLDPSSPQLTIGKSAPYADSFLAIVQIVEEMQKCKIPGKTLVCVRAEMLNQMGLNLIETSANVVIISREKESLHRRLQGRALDLMATHYMKALDISDEEAKIRVLQEAEVLLAVTGNCFYEDIQCMTKDLTYCIIHDAHSFTDPESCQPLLYGIRHLILLGEIDELCHVSSKCAVRLGYNKSLFHRACQFR